MTDFAPSNTPHTGQALGRLLADPAHPDPHPVAPDTTGELLTRMQSSEPGVALQLYDRFADRVHDFVLFITRDSAMAAATTRDVIVMTAHQEPAALADPAALRARLYAMARNETFAVLRTRGRTPADDRVVEVPPLPANPTTADLGGMVWTAMAAFSERDQALVTLHLRHGLSGEALSDAMGLSAGAVDVLLPSTLERVEAQLDALLALATGRVPDAASADLHEVSEEWDGKFSPLVRGRVTQMLEECGGAVPADVPGPMSLLQSIPLVPAPAALRDAVAERLALASRLGAGVARFDADIDDTIPPGAGPDPVGLQADPADAPTIPPGAGPPPVIADREVEPLPVSGAQVGDDLPEGGAAVSSTVPAAGHTANGSAGTAPGDGIPPGTAAATSTPPGATQPGPPPAQAPPAQALHAQAPPAQAPTPDPPATVIGRTDGGSGPGPDGPGGAPGAGVPLDAAADASGITLASAEDRGPTPVGGVAPSIGDDPRRAPARTPLPLAIALGIAVGLVVAAGIFRIVGTDVAPAADAPAVAASLDVLADPTSGVAAPLAGATAGGLDEALDTPTPVQTPGRLSGPGDEVVVEAGETTALQLNNPGGEPLTWRVTDLPSWVRLDRTQGVIEPAATVEITVGYGEALGEGDYAGAVGFAWDGSAPGTLAVPLVGAIEQPPNLQNLQVGSRALGAQGCGEDQTGVAVMVADESPLAQVLVTADGPDPETQTQFALAPDPAQPSRHVGVVGPFQGAGQVVVRIQAVDARGNEAGADGGVLAIAAC